MASDWDGVSVSAIRKLSTAAVNSGSIRTLTWGCFPVAGRPLFLGVTFIVDAMI